METAEIRRRWLAFFEKNGHTVVPSAPLHPRRPEPAVRQRRHGAVHALLPRPGDPAVPAATSVQKCVRTRDIEEVGKTTAARHVLPDERQLLLRRLLQGGGDHARLGADHHARQDEGGYGFDADLIWATVYHDDDEAFAIWRDGIGLPDGADRRAAASSTTTGHMGVPGPGGPC